MSLYLNNKISFIQNSIKYPFVWIAKKLQYISNILKVGFNASKHFIEDNNHEQSLVALTPKLLDRETTSFFDKELYAALSEKNGSRIRNIAVSGGYSVGKSSHLLSFQHNHPNFEYAQISLAKFLDVTVEPKNNSSENTPLEAQRLSEEEKTKLLSERIEEGITQQLLYSAKTKQLPNSRLQRIREHSKTKLIFGSFCILIFVGSWTKIFKAEYINTALTRLKFLNDSTPDNSRDINYILDFFSYSVLVLGAAVVAFILYRLFLNSGLSRVSIKSGKVEFQNHGSVLHQHLDEIIYYFEKTKVNVVIFEDMDRFDKVEIFSTLREINGLLNNASQIGQPIYFIYAVKDNLFEQKERVKFFDLLLPIIPVVNSNNAKELLIERLTKIGYCITQQCENKHTDLDQTLVHTSAFYMDDMRLITNFVNELVIYKERIFSKAKGLDINKLYAIVLVKNLYPTEYSKLLERTGKVFNIFNKANTAKKGYIKKLEDELSRIKNDFDECEKLTEHSHIENNLVFTYLFSRVKTDAESLVLRNNERINILESPTEETIFTEDSEITQYRRSRNTYHDIRLNPTIKTIQVKNAKGLSYLESRKYIDLLNENKSQELKDRQKQIEQKIKTINQMSLTELLKIDSIYEETLNELNGEFGALEFLLKQGFFSTDYYDYISYFYEGTLTQKDKFSLLTLREGKSLEVAQKLEKVESFAFELTEIDTVSGKLINLDLMEYLLKNDHGLLSLILRDSSQYVDKLLEMIVLIEENTSINKLVTCLNQYNSPVLSTLLIKANESHNEEHVITFLAALINELSLNDFSKLVKGNENIIDIINSIENFGDLYKRTCGLKQSEMTETSKAFWEGAFPIKIKKVSFDESFNDVFNTNMYEVNKDNYVTILSVKLGIETGKNYQSNFLSYKDILATGNIILIEQVNENLEKFVEIATLENFNEDEASTISLLNKLDLNLEKFIQGSPIEISDIKSIERFEVQKLLFSHFKIKNELTNLLRFFTTWSLQVKAKKLDNEEELEERARLKSSLISFINSNGITLPDAIFKDSKQDLDRFIKEIILNKDINIGEFNKFVTAYNFNSDFVIDCLLTREQWNSFIENICNKYEFSIFTQIPEDLINTNILYLEKFWEELNLEEIFNHWPLTNEILLVILDSKTINEKQKIELLTSENKVIEFLNSEHADKGLFDKSVSLLVKLTEDKLLGVLDSGFPMETLLSTCMSKTQVATIVSKIINNKNTLEQLTHYISFIDDIKLSTLFNSLNGRKTIESSAERSLIIKALIKIDFIGWHEFNENSIKFNFKPSKFVK